MNCHCRFSSHKKVDGHLIGCEEVNKKRLEDCKCLKENDHAYNAALGGCASQDCSCHHINRSDSKS